MPYSSEIWAIIRADPTAFSVLNSPSVFSSQYWPMSHTEQLYCQIRQEPLEVRRPDAFSAGERSSVDSVPAVSVGPSTNSAS